MMHSRLVRRGTPAKDLLTGPSSAPERYRLLEELSTTRGDFASENAASRCVWTAEDTIDGGVVVLKVHAQSTWKSEAWALRRLAGFSSFHDNTPLPSPSPSHPSQSRFVKILDSFLLPDENSLEASIVWLTDWERWYVPDGGVVVLPLLGPSVAVWQRTRPSPFFPLPLVRQIAKQVLLALEYLHTGLGEGEDVDGIISGEGLAHGNVCRENLLLSTDYPAQDPREDKPSSSLNVKLIGFSGSTGSTREIIVGSVLSPQTVLEPSAQGPASSADIWAVGTLTCDLLFDRDLVYYGARNYREDAAALASLYPGEPWPEVLTHGYYCVADPLDPDTGIPPYPSLRQRIEKEGRVTAPEEVEQLHSFLKACWTLDAEDRPSARWLLEHEWLRGVE